MPIISYQETATRDIAESVNAKGTRRALPLELHNAARRQLAVIDAMTALAELAAFPRWRIEALRGDRAGQHSIRINAQYQICFIWNGTDAEQVEITDYH